MKNTLCAVAFFATGSLLAPSFARGAGDEEVLRTIVDGYRANRDAFRFMLAHCIATHGKARSMVKALAGEYLANDQIVAKGFYAKQGDTERTDLIYPPELQEKYRVQLSDHSFETYYVSERRLGNATILAWHFPDNGQATISGERRDGLAYNLVRPFDMGLNGKNQMMAMDNLIEVSLAGAGSTCTFDGEIEFERRPVWQVTCSLDEMTVRILLDHQRGFVPVRQEISSEGQLVYSFGLLDLQQCSQNRWVPVRGVTVFKPAEPDGLASFREIRITKFEVDQPPPPEALRLDLPAGTSVTDSRNKTGWKAGQDGMPRQLDLNDVQMTVSRKGSAAATPTSLGNFPYSSAGLPEQQSSRWIWWTMTVVVGLVVLTMVFILVRRRFCAGAA